MPGLRLVVEAGHAAIGQPVVCSPEARGCVSDGEERTSVSGVEYSVE